MPSRNTIESLTSDVVINDIHHLLWDSPRQIGETMDYGWSCEPHAFVLSAAAVALRCDAKIVTGSAFYVQGEEEDQPPVGVSMDPHAWCEIIGFGMCDFSPRLSDTIGEDWRPWDLRAIIAGRSIPDGKFSLFTDRRSFENAVASATHDAGTKHALYYATGQRIITRDHLTDAFSNAGSPLTQRLIERFSPQLYPKAAVHIANLAKGNTQPLSHLSQEKAWEELEQQPGDAVEWICVRGGLD